MSFYGGGSRWDPDRNAETSNYGNLSIPSSGRARYLQSFGGGQSSSGGGSSGISGPQAAVFLGVFAAAGLSYRYTWQAVSFVSAVLFAVGYALRPVMRVPRVRHVRRIAWRWLKRGILVLLVLGVVRIGVIYYQNLK